VQRFLHHFSRLVHRHELLHQRIKAGEAVPELDDVDAGLEFFASRPPETKAMFRDHMWMLRRAYPDVSDDQWNRILA